MVPKPTDCAEGHGTVWGQWGIRKAAVEWNRSLAEGDQMYTTIFLDWNVFLLPLLIATAFTLVRVVANHFLLKVGITPLFSNTSLSSIPVHMTPHVHTHTANSSLFQVKSRKL